MNKTETNRCAIYVRKSDPSGLEQQFNSLDNQRLRGEMYIQSKTDMGWICLSETYEDAGISGEKIANRPGVKKLLTHIEAGKIDTVVVYKLDRLSRSTFEVLELFKMFDKKGVNFVSLTENIDTSSPGGRMVLTILAAMGQMERELASERVKDKIASSKRQGYWMGGCPPLGYDIDNRSLVINETEAETVRLIFSRYLSSHSVVAIVKELRKLNLTTKTWTSRSGRNYIGKPFFLNAVIDILKNPIYCGKIAFKGELYAGKHEAIVSEADFNLATGIMSGQTRKAIYTRTVSSDASVLKGLIRCGHCGCPMTSTFTMKKNREYRYYICNHHLRGVSHSCPVKRIPAGEAEAFIEREITAILKSDAFSDQIGDDFHRFDAVWSELFIGEKACIIENLIKTIYIFENKVEIDFLTEGLGNLAADITGVKRIDGKDGTLIHRSYPIKIARKQTGKAVLICPVGTPAIPTDDPEPSALLSALVAAWRWKTMLDTGICSSFDQIATKEKGNRRYISRLFQMNFLAPDIVEAIVSGTAPRELTLQDIKSGNIPNDWNEQRKLFGFETL